MKQKTLVQSIDKIVNNLLAVRAKLVKLDSDTRIVVYSGDCYLEKVSFKMGLPKKSTAPFGKNPHTVSLQLGITEHY